MFDSAQVWAELPLLQAKQNYGDNKEISPEKIQIRVSQIGNDN